MLMDLVPDDKARGLKTPVWDEYKRIINQAEGKEVRTLLSPSSRSTHHLLALSPPDAGGAH